MTRLPTDTSFDADWFFTQLGKLTLGEEVEEYFTEVLMSGIGAMLIPRKECSLDTLVASIQEVVPADAQITVKELPMFLAMLITILLANGISDPE